MKKILLLSAIILITNGCYAQEQYSSVNNNNSEEIILDINTPKKDYSLKKTDYRNNPKIENDDDDNDMPIDFTPTPLRLLKQLQADNF